VRELTTSDEEDLKKRFAVLEALTPTSS